MKSYEIEFKTKRFDNKLYRLIEITDKVEITINDNTDISQIVNFVDGVKKIYTAAMKATKRMDDFKLEIISAVYEIDPNKKLVQKDFNLWEFEGYNEDAEGIYLQPDTRYTEACRDIYLTKDTLHDLCSI